MVFRFLPRNFRGSEERKNPCLFGGFPCLFQKKQGKEDQGTCPPKLRKPAEYRVEDMRPNWPFFKHRAPKCD